MSTIQRKWPARVAGTVLAAVVVVTTGCSQPEAVEATSPRATTSVPTTAVPPTTSVVVRVSPSASAPTPAKTVPTTTTQPATPTVATYGVAPEAERQTYFGLNLPFGNRWVIVDALSNSGRKVFVDSDRCGSAPGKDTPCPGFAIVNFTRGEDQLPYGNNGPDFKAPPRPDGTRCHYNGINSGLSYEALKTVDQVVVGQGVRMRHATQRQCDGGDVQHSWRDDKRKLVVFDFGRYEPGTTPIPGVVELLNAARWY